ncbi:phosphoribosylformylglycinamidine cyclo-ligase [Candidatus Micrarchaeota archaeon]|nr:phosphoribosylformylglycinamidine cyclo-ligase [Candidatus Micrarchaeota archaeon]
MEGLTYSQAGVDRIGREEAKKALRGLEATYSLSRYGQIIATPFNVLYPIGNGKYHVKTCDGVGTKVLLAQLAGKHDTIGTDGIAMVANDCIRCGATPIALTDVVDVRKSEEKLLSELQKGLVGGATLAGCPLVGGETADLPEVLSALYHINCDCVGEVEADEIVSGREITAGDMVLGLRSSGVHSNGISLVRRVLFREWGGKFDAFAKLDGFEEELVYEVLKPTKIYVKPVLKAMQEHHVLGAVHITGDAYLKFRRLGHGFVFDNFKPHPIFDLIQRTGNVAGEEMFKTFNMGYGFALVVGKKEADDVIDLLEREREEAEVIGKVGESKEIVVNHGGKKMVLG